MERNFNKENIAQDNDIYYCYPQKTLFKLCFTFCCDYSWKVSLNDFEIVLSAVCWIAKILRWFVLFFYSILNTTCDSHLLSQSPSLPSPFPTHYFCLNIEVNYFEMWLTLNIYTINKNIQYLYTPFKIYILFDSRHTLLFQGK